ncbi:hypothetical protein GC093_28410 [Paenibacillus sp. LMG 31456]|uniref:Uncharacterized protein n=1 Tax=Paenibacillus foliorum TaxID=2654974 RepID=A0A972K4N0_9BACL|nr:DUF6886 family protein [Paenibacillus foliorum]NOU97118.1 hypothetical protein [Paenibacillus foliorum]
MLYHFSEEPVIEVFVPRIKQNRQDMPPVVWAIDKEHEFTFYFPRNCPRIVYKKSEEVSKSDKDRFFGDTSATTIVTIESRWYKELKNFTIYKYAFDEQGFELFDKTAGYYISHQTVNPQGVEPVSHLIDKLLDTGIELRFTPTLYPLRDAILASTVLDFGIHRFNHARE